MNKLDLQVKGIHGGVLITLPSVPWYQQRDLLVGRIQAQERFFKGGRIALDVGSTDWSGEQVLKLLKDLADEGVCLWTILSSSEKTRQAAEYHGFPTSLPDPNKKPIENQLSETAKIESVDNIACLSRSLAEGERFQHHGDLLLIGDIPHDAELEVKGSLILWGTLHGIAAVSADSHQVIEVRLLKIVDGRIMVEGKELEIPPKLRKQNGLVIIRNENGVEIRSVLPRRLI